MSQILTLSATLPEKNPRAIPKTILPALVIAAKPDASLLSQQEPVYRMGKSRKGGEFDVQ